MCTQKRDREPIKNRPSERRSLTRDVDAKYTRRLNQYTSRVMSLSDVGYKISGYPMAMCGRLAVYGTQSSWWTTCGVVWCRAFITGALWSVVPFNVCRKDIINMPGCQLDFFYSVAGLPEIQALSSRVRASIGHRIPRMIAFRPILCTWLFKLDLFKFWMTQTVQLIALPLDCAANTISIYAGVLTCSFQHRRRRNIANSSPLTGRSSTTSIRFTCTFIQGGPKWTNGF